MIDARSTYLRIEETRTDTAIVPVGATEQHGPHLPLGVDYLLAEAVAKGIGRELDAFVLPAMPFGASQAHAGFRGSLSLGYETLNSVVRDLTRCLFDQGFARVAVLNMHGGNVGLVTAVREVNAGQQKGRAIVVDPLRLASGQLSAIIETLAGERHAGEYETSLMLHLYPDLVIGTAADCVPRAPQEYFDALPLKVVSPTGVWGCPSRASAEKGALTMGVLIEVTSRHIREVFGQFDQLREPTQGMDRLRSY